MVAYNPYAPENVLDPYPTFRRLRDEAPVYHNAEMNFWALSRYDDVCAAHRDAKRFVSGEGITIEGSEKGMPLLILRDPPDHSWHKGLVSRVFTPARMAALEPFIRDRAVALLEALDGREEVDFVHDFTVELPLSVICELIDIPLENRRELHERANAPLLRGDDRDPEAARTAQIEQHRFFQGLAAARRANPRDDAITLLINTEVKDEAGGTRRLDDFEIATHFAELATAGHETVAKALASGLIALHHFPEQRARLQADTSLIPAAVEELLRYDPPSQMQGRTTSVDVTLHGVTIPAGSRTMLLPRARRGTSAPFPTPTATRSAAAWTSARSISAMASTNAWASTWRGWRCGSRSRNCSAAIPTMRSIRRARSGRRSPCCAEWPTCRCAPAVTPDPTLPRRERGNAGSG